MKEHPYWTETLNACRWSSMHPERTATVLLGDLDRHLADVLEEMRDVADDTRDADTEFEAYREGYTQRWRAWMAARGRTASVMVTGASNFPGKRNRQRLDTEHKRSTELTEWSTKARKDALARLKPPRDHAADLARQEELLEAMKAANKVVRKKWPDERKIAALVADVGLSEATARKVLEPDFCGRIGFPSHSLASVRGKIKRLRAKVEP